MTHTQIVTEGAGIGPCAICSDLLTHGLVATWTIGGWAHEDCADSPLAAPVDTTDLTPKPSCPEETAHTPSGHDRHPTSNTDTEVLP